MSGLALSALETMLTQAGSFQHRAQDSETVDLDFHSLLLLGLGHDADGGRDYLPRTRRCSILLGLD